MAGTDSDRDMLVRAAREGRPDARGALLAAHRNYLRLIARTAIGGALRAKADASDIVQETLLRAHAAFDGFRGGTAAEFLAWLRRILARQIADAARRYVDNEGRRIARERPLDEAVDRSSRAFDDLLAATGTSPSAGAAEAERALLLADALARLPADSRDVIVFRSLEELEWSEVGARMGRTPDAVRMLWVRALRALGRQLGGTE